MTYLVLSRQHGKPWSLSSKHEHFKTAIAVLKLLSRFERPGQGGIEYQVVAESALRGHELARYGLGEPKQDNYWDWP